MAKLFVIAGHGASDPGACSGGYSEADLVRRLASRLKALGGSEVQVGNTNVNWYASNYIGKGYCPKGVPVIELHMDSASPSAKGGHVIIKKGYKADAYDNALASFIGSFFPGRSIKIVGRSDLANPNRAAKMGVNYRLVECGFISNSGDRSKFINQMDDLARGILKAFGITGGSSSSGGGSTAPSSGYVVSVNVAEGDKLNIRSGAGTNYNIVGEVHRGEAYTIVEEANGQGANKWGKLKSGAGWIALDFTTRVGGGSTAPAKKSIDEIAREVIAGKWGNGSDRKKRIEAAGYDYNAVQNRVNQLL